MTSSAKKKVELEILPALGLLIAILGASIGATWFIISRIENSRISLLNNQVNILQSQIKILNKEVEEKTQTIRKIAELFKGDQRIMDLITEVLKEGVGILGSRQISINEAVMVPNTDLVIVYENFIHYPWMKSFRNLLPVLARRWITFPSTLSANAGGKKILNNLLPRAGTEVLLKHNKETYKLIVLTVMEGSVTIEVFKK